MHWYKKSQSENFGIISLSPSEESIFSFIKEARDRFAPGVAMRVAGGWVRDKLMGKESDDIDIAVSGGDGVAIANAMSMYDKQENAGRTGKSYELSLEKGGDSAGLRVGAIDIDGVKIDFVPLRTEQYSEGSRVPKMVPTDDYRQDAVRRDLTINAMYYNIDTGQIEDPSNGMSDIKNKILRTPTDPISTLTEDPLRAIRALRFLSKMQGFKLDPALEDAIAHPDVHSAWERKVAFERVRKELEGIAKGSNPADAFKVMLESGLYMPMFKSDRMNGFNPVTMDQNNPHHDLNLLNHTVEVVRNMNDIMKREGYGERERMLSVLAALFHDFGKMDPSIVRPSKSIPGASSYPGHEDVSSEIAEEVLKRLGFGPERELVSKIVKEHMRPHGSLETPKAIGRFVREFSDMKTDDPMKHSLADIVMLHSEADARAKGGGPSQEELEEKQATRNQVKNYMSSVSNQSKPLLDGRELIALFPNLNPKTGFIKKMTEAMNEARDEGKIHDSESAKKYLQSIYGLDGNGMQKGSALKMNWYKLSRTMAITGRGDENIQDGGSDLFYKNKINPNRDKDVSIVAIEDGRPAIEDGKVIGAVADQWKRGWGQEFTESEDEEIYEYSFDLVVHPDFRRAGVGKKLIDDAMRKYESEKQGYREASGLRTMMRLEVVNPALIPYLRSIGFIMESREDDPGPAYLIKW